MQHPSQGAAKIIYEGVRDASGRVINLSPTVSPSHVPLVFLLSDKSYDEPKYLSPTQLTRVLGSQTLNKLSKFYSHQSLLTDIVAKNGSPVLYYPVKVPGRTKAKIRLSVSILQPLLDGDSQPPGRLVWSDDLSGYPEDLQNYTAGDVYPSDLASTATYPILDAELSYYGESGNKVGFVLEAVSLDEMTNLMLPRRAAVYKFGLIEISPTGATVPILTVNGEDKVFVTLTKDVVDSTNTSLYLPHVFDRHYFHGAGNTLENFGEFEAIYVYDDVISKLLTRLYDLEVGYDDAIPSGFREDWELGSDVANQVYLNIVSGKHIDGLTNYQGFGVDRQGLVGTGNKVLAQGGSSGIPELRSQREKFIQANTLLDTYVTDLGSSITEDSIFADDARFDYTLMYDSGFAMSAKEALTNLLTSRSDVMLIMTPHSYGELNEVEDSGLPSVFRLLALNPTTLALIAGKADEFGLVDSPVDEDDPNSLLIRDFILPHRYEIVGPVTNGNETKWTVRQYFYDDNDTRRISPHWIDAGLPFADITRLNSVEPYLVGTVNISDELLGRSVTVELQSSVIMSATAAYADKRTLVASAVIPATTGDTIPRGIIGSNIYEYTSDFDGTEPKWIEGTTVVEVEARIVSDTPAMDDYLSRPGTASHVDVYVKIADAHKVDLIKFGSSTPTLAQMIEYIGVSESPISIVGDSYKLSLSYTNDDVPFELRGNGFGALDTNLIRVDALNRSHVLMLDRSNNPVVGSPSGPLSGFRLLVKLAAAQISCEGATDRVIISEDLVYEEAT